LVHNFGQYVFARLYDLHREYLPEWNNAFDVFRKIDDHIHIEVVKLYPDAELPKFIIEKDTNEEMILLYSSVRPLAPFAEGIIQGCIEYFNTPMSVEHITLDMVENRYQAKFIIKKTMH
jgi:hypothetical protein